MRRVRRGVTAVLAGAHRPEDDQVQFNAGEIRLRLKMLRVVPEGLEAETRMVPKKLRYLLNHLWPGVFSVPSIEASQG